MRPRARCASAAGRWQRLTEEITELDVQLERLVATAAPALVAVNGVGTQTAAELLVAAGDNPERLQARARSRTCAGWHRSRPHPARPPGIG